LNGTASSPAPVGDAGLTARSSPLIVAAAAPQFNFFAGALDEIAIYDRALDQAQIARHFAAGS
jgi:hypothetical protein